MGEGPGRRVFLSEEPTDQCHVFGTGEQGRHSIPTDALTVDFEEPNGE